jgi:MFS family permease
VRAPGGASRARPPLRGVVLRIALVIGLAQLGFATVIPLLPLHLTERLGASVKLVGLVVASFALVETFLKAVWGSVADRLGRRPMIIGGLVVSALAPVIMSLLRTAWFFVPLRLVDGAGSSALWPAAAAIIADTTPPHRRATAMGTLNMCFFAGLGLGPALGLYVAGFAGSYVAGFYLASAMLLAAAALAALSLRGLGATHRVADVVEIGYHGAPRSPHLEEVLAEGRRYPLLPVMLVVAFLQMFGAGLLAPILVIYAKRVVGLSEHVMGTLFLVLMLSIALVSLPAGRLADRWGKLRAVSWGMALTSLGMWALPLSPGLVVLAPAAGLLGAGYAISTPAWHAVISQLAPTGRVGLAIGASQTAQGMGLVLGPLLGGLLWDEVSHQAPFLGAAILLSAGTGLLALAVRRAGPGGSSAPR